MTTRFVLGLDIGQAADFSAVVIVERVGQELHARHVERLPLAMSYPKQVDRVKGLVTSAELARDVTLAVDATGVGRPITDLLRVALRPFGTKVISITITGGSAVSRVGSRGACPSGISSQRPKLPCNPGDSRLPLSYRSLRCWSTS